MPTGYTAPVQRGEVTDLPTFAMECARAFGALVSMRDEPMGATIPDEFAPVPYYMEAVERARANLERLRMMSNAEADAAAAEQYASDLARWEERARRVAEERARYEAMLAKVRAWTPPTPEHTGLKVFMIEQLTGSIDFDCSDGWQEYDPRPEPKLGSNWLREQVKRAIDEVERAEKNLADEQRRQSERTAWVKALRDSFATKTEEAARG